MHLLSGLLLKSAETILQYQRQDGSFSPGHNGPYYDPETPVRNTSHWLITLLKVFELSGERKFKDAAKKAAAYLVSEETRPMKATFWCRMNPQKDFCNGLIGQAWAIEALALGAEKLDEPKLKRVAQEVFLLHPFDEKIGLWQRVNVDGSYSSFDQTLNHQLWFAASGSLLSAEQRNQIGSHINRFMDMLPHHMNVHRSGLIRHSIEVDFAIGQGLYKFPASILRMTRRIRSPKSSQARIAKEIGYHAFNLYALAILKKEIPQHSFWEADKFKATLHYVRRDEFAQGLENNKYGYAYNPPGFELTYALHIFSPFLKKDVRPLISSWVSEQIKRCYDFNTNLMSRNTEDPITLAARLYEATRLPDMELQLDLGATHN